MGKTYTQEDVVAEIGREVEKTSFRRLAAKTGVSHAYLSDIVSGRRDVSDTVASIFGFKKVVTTKVWFVREGK